MEGKSRPTTGASTTGASTTGASTTGASTTGASTTGAPATGASTTGAPAPAVSAGPDALSALEDLVAARLVGQQEFARNLGLSVTDLVCFAYVMAAGVEEVPVTAGDLAGRAHVTTGAVTGILNRLERGGFVTRQPDPADGRRVRVSAVPAAAERVGAVFGPHHTQLLALFADYTPDETAVIADWLQRAAALSRTYLDDSCET